MSKFNDLLNLRFKQKIVQQDKMTALVERANNGDLSSFSGIFRICPLNEKETTTLESILKDFRQNDTYDVHADLTALSAITSEVKAIANQAVILHGERIKRAQDILKKYRDGAFTAWLFATYGNRQTPYNFLQYYEFYTMMPPSLHPLIDQMPRQAIYTLASRSGSTSRKEEIVKNHSTLTKYQLLNLIRTEFPLEETDKRSANFASQAIHLLKRAKETLQKPQCLPREEEQQQIKALLTQLRSLINRN